MKRPLFVLETDGSVRPAYNQQEYLSFMEDNTKKILAQDQAYSICQIVTSFLGKEPLSTTKKKKSPMLFETLVTGGVIDGSVRLYTSYEAAMAGHKAIVQLIHNSIN